VNEIARSIARASDQDVCAQRHGATSAWSIGQQLEHLLLTDRVILAWLHAVAKGMMASDGPGGPTWRGHLVIGTGFIPRGKGRAPDVTRPDGMELPAIRSGFAEVQDEAESLADLLPTLAADSCTRRHPALGYFTPPQWLRFAQVHHRHHRKIIRDILKATR
jgi:hypothetical protein